MSNKSKALFFILSLAVAILGCMFLIFILYETYFYLILAFFGAYGFFIVFRSLYFWLCSLVVQEPEISAPMPQPEDVYFSDSEIL